jgi:hypothetical protein
MEGVSGSLVTIEGSGEYYLAVTVRSIEAERWINRYRIQVLIARMFHDGSRRQDAELKGQGRRSIYRTG